MKMNKPDRAAEMAKELLSKLCEVGCCDHPDEEMCPDNHQPALIAQALRNYGDERFNEALDAAVNFIDNECGETGHTGISRNTGDRLKDDMERLKTKSPSVGG